jgi:hypothetical protein
MEKKQDIDSTDTESIIVAGEKIIQRHTAMGPASPLNNLLIADLNSRISIARLKHDEGMKYKKLMEDAWRDRDHYLGAKDRSVQFTLQAIVNILRQENCNLGEWGLK